MNQQYRNVLKIKCFGSFSSWHSFLFVSKHFIQIIVFGYITVDTYITFGDSRPDLDHAAYLANVASISCIFNAARGVWSGLLDRFSYK